MKDIKRIERAKIEASEETNYQGFLTEQVDIEIHDKYIRIVNEENQLTTICRGELTMLLKYLEKNQPNNGTSSPENNSFKQVFLTATCWKDCNLFKKCNALFFWWSGMLVGIYND